MCNIDLVKVTIGVSTIGVKYCILLVKVSVRVKRQGLTSLPPFDPPLASILERNGKI